MITTKPGKNGTLIVQQELQVGIVEINSMWHFCVKKESHDLLNCPDVFTLHYSLAFRTKEIAESMMQLYIDEQQQIFQSTLTNWRLKDGY